MTHQFYMPTRILMGKDCITENAHEFKALGTKAIIVTYPVSKLNGSLKCVQDALSSQGMSYEVFDGVQENPSWTIAMELGKLARESGCDLVIGIGGGSAIDSAKATATLAVNDITIDELYKGAYQNPVLPTVMVPTTAGTGAEVTFNGVLTLDGKAGKKSFGNLKTCPTLAMLDATFTMDMPLNITRMTAVDALTHAVEGFLSAKATPIGSVIARECFRVFQRNYEGLTSGKLDFDARAQLLLNATFSGIMIVQERTLAPHAMGYPLTVERGLPHGVASGALCAAFCEQAYKVIPAKIDEMLPLLGLGNIGELFGYIKSLLGDYGAFTEAELAQYADDCYNAATVRPNPMEVTKELILSMYKRSLM